MAKKKRLFYDFSDLFRQDKMDDYIFSYFLGVKSVMPAAQLKQIAEHFQYDFCINEDVVPADIILASYQRSLDKYRRFTKIDNDFNALYS